MRNSEQESRPSAIRKVVAVVAAAALVAGVTLYWLACFGSPDGPFDFIDLNYYRAALTVVVAEQPLYAALPYPPFAVLAIAPLGGLSVVLGNQLWTAATLITAVILAVVVTWRATEARGEESADRWELLLRGSVAALLLLVSMPLFSQIANGQLTIFIAALSFLDVSGVVPRKARGVLVGLAGAIKLTPLIFIPYFLVTGQRRQAAVATASFGAATALGFAMFPSDSLFFWSHLGKSDQFGDPARADNLSIHAALMRWVPMIGQYTLVWIGLALVVAVFAMLRARKHFLAGERMEAALTVGASSVVLAPIAWPHYHVWVMLVALWLVTFSTRRHQVVGITICLVYAMPVVIWADWAFDLAVLIPILIGLFGLPHRSVATAVTTPSHPDAVPTAA